MHRYLWACKWLSQLVTQPYQTLYQLVKEANPAMNIITSIITFYGVHLHNYLLLYFFSIFLTFKFTAVWRKILVSQMYYFTKINLYFKTSIFWNFCSTRLSISWTRFSRTIQWEIDLIYKELAFIAMIDTPNVPYKN